MRVQQNNTASSPYVFFLLTVLALLSFISESTVSAAPTKKEPFPTDPAVLAQVVQTQPNTALFWYGRRGGASLLAGSATFAKSQGLKTVAMRLTEEGYKGPDAKTQRIENVSRAFAQGASGVVRVLVGSLLDAKTGKNLDPATFIWGRIELPTLKASGKVTQIIEINDADKSEKVIWSASGSASGSTSGAPKSRTPSPAPKARTPSPGPAPKARAPAAAAPKKRVGGK